MQWILITLFWSLGSSHASTWSTDYSDALAQVNTNLSAACTTLSRLANTRKEPLAPLATTRKIQYCPYPNPITAINTLKQVHSGYPWLRPLASEVLVALARKHQDSQTLVDFTPVFFKLLSSQSEKELLLQEALSAARNLNLKVQENWLRNELYKLSPRLERNPPPTRWLKAADDFRNNQDFNQASILYEQILGKNSFDTFSRFKAINGLREIRKSQYRFFKGPLQEFISASERMANFTHTNLNAKDLNLDQQRILFEALVQNARDHWSYADVNVAKSKLIRIASMNLYKPFRAYAFWMLARIEGNLGNWIQAANNGRQATLLMIDELNSSKRWGAWFWTLWDDSFWTASFSQRKAGLRREAADLLQFCLRYTKNPNAIAKFSFWIARNLSDSGIDSTNEWIELARIDRHGYYGFMAHNQLNLPLSALPNIDTTNPKRPPEIGNKEFDLLLQLATVKEWTLAQTYLSNFIPTAKINHDEMILRAHLHDYSTIANLFFTNVQPSDRNTFTDVYASLLYPRPYLNLVQSARTLAPNIEEEYVYAIMRQESGFNPKVRSWANAYGLLQLLPRVARETQDKAGVSFKEDYELFRPEINIPIGVAHMDDLSLVAGRSFILRTSSYNATVDKTIEWKNRLFKGDVSEWIEEIPYDETRSYVRLVMRNYLMYLRVGARGDTTIPTTLLNL